MVTLTIVTAADFEGDFDKDWFQKTRKLALESGGVYFSGIPKSKLSTAVPPGFAFRDRKKAEDFKWNAKGLLEKTP